MLSKAVQAFGKFGECIGELWKNVIQPFVSWIIQTLAPVVGPLIKNLGSILCQKDAVVQGNAAFTDHM